MIIIPVPDSILVHCKNQVEKFNFGKRKFANGSKSQQLTGIIGQSVVTNLFNKGLIDGNEGFDNGVDLIFNNKKIDIKTMGRTTSVKNNYTNNFLKVQDYFDTEIYIFCSYHKLKNEVTICGWITKKEFVKKRKFYPKGTIRKRFDGTTFNTFSDLYEIDNIDLHNANSIEQLKTELNILS